MDSKKIDKMENKINQITSFSGEFEFASNFFPCQILDKEWGIVFRSGEHMFQSRKTFDFADKIMIRDCDTPGKAKRAGRRIILRSDWELIKVPVMFDVVFSKFHQNPELAKLLKETGDAELIEGNNWHDNFWGSCSCLSCRTKKKENWLGKLLMDIRQLENL